MSQKSEETLIFIYFSLVADSFKQQKGLKLGFGCSIEIGIRVLIGISRFEENHMEMGN